MSVFQILYDRNFEKVRIARERELKEIEERERRAKEEYEKRLREHHNVLLEERKQAGLKIEFQRERANEIGRAHV